MKRSKRVTRRLILSKLFEYIHEEYSVLCSREQFVEGDLSLHDIDALLAFRSNPRIEELRRALDRLEDGTYGLCISCKSPIGLDVLDCDPARRVCNICEEKLLHISSGEFVPTQLTT